MQLGGGAYFTFSTIPGWLTIAELSGLPGVTGPITSLTPTRGGILKLAHHDEPLFNSLMEHYRYLGMNNRPAST